MLASNSLVLVLDPQKAVMKTACDCATGRYTLVHPPPLPLDFGQKAFLRERGGGGVYFETPRGRIFITPPLSYTPPTHRRLFSGVRAVYKVWAPDLFIQTQSD